MKVVNGADLSEDDLGTASGGVTSMNPGGFHKQHYVFGGLEDERKINELYMTGKLKAPIPTGVPIQRNQLESLYLKGVKVTSGGAMDSTLKGLGFTVYGETGKMK